MLSHIEMSDELRDAFLEIASNYQLKTPVYPKKFISLLESNIGVINPMKRYGEMDSRNPMIVALGDSVTGGHFETLMKENALYFVQNLSQAYVEQFKHMLQEACGISTLNIVNSAIAGDNIKNMEVRLYRDVLQYKPDLVLLNAALNWSNHQGDTNLYEHYLRTVVGRIQKESQAEIVLITPNMAIASEKDSCLGERVEVIRKLAKEYDTCLVDVYEVWELFVQQQLDIHGLFANKENHPTAVGHKVYAILIMKLFSSIRMAEWITIPEKIL